jgi:hypothetical protein
MTDAERLASLEIRLHLLEDREETRFHRDAYHGCVNNSRYAEIADLFTGDAYVKLGYLAQYRGRAEINARFQSMGTRERFYIKQYIHSHRIKIDGDVSSGHSYFDARYGRFGVSYLVAGRYGDSYARTTAGWRFTQMLIDFDYTVPAGVGWCGDERQYLQPK